MKRFQLLIIIAGVLFSLKTHAQNASADSLVEKLGKGFTSDTASVNGTVLHYVKGGNGPCIILIHGFPQDWYEYHQIMPRLSENFTVIAVDLRGVGKSMATTNGYDSPNLAEDVYQLVQHLKLNQVYIVGHDIGGLVAYAFVRLHAKATRGIMILDVPLPGIEPWNESVNNPLLWTLNFHQTPNLPEELVTGKQNTYFHFILDPFHIGNAEVNHYASAYGTPGQLHAGFEFYRAFTADGKFNAAQNSAVEVPLVWAAGESSFFGKIGPEITQAFREHGCSNVKNEIIRNSGHYVINEQPEAVAALIEHYALH